MPVAGAGELTERVTFEKADTATANEFGEQVADYEDLGSRKCKVEALSAHNRILAGATGQQTSYRVSLYYWPTIDTPCRLRLTWAGLTLIPDGPPVYQGRWMEILCSEAH